MTLAGGRLLAAWVAAALLGALLVLAFTMLALRPLLAYVQTHATSIAQQDAGYAGVRMLVGVCQQVIATIPAAFVLGRRLRGVEVPWVGAAAAAALVAGLIQNTPTSLAFWSGYPPAGFDPVTALVVRPLALGAIFGAIGGTAHALVLWRRLSGAAWWIAAAVAGSALAGPVTALVGWQIGGAGARPTTLADYWGETLATLGIGAVLVSLVTGLTLVWLLDLRREPLSPAAA